MACGSASAAAGMGPRVRLYNTLTRSPRRSKPGTTARSGVYCCGPTVYDVPHAGHARAAVAFDVLVRHLRARGYEVTVRPQHHRRRRQDPERARRERRRRRSTLSEPHGRRVPASKWRRSAACPPSAGAQGQRPSCPRSSRSIAKLIERGAAYVVDMPGGTRDVYFSVRSFPELRQAVAPASIDELLAGARVEKDESKQRSARLRAVEGRARGGVGLGEPLGPRASGLAHRVLGDERQVPRPRLRHPRRRHGPDLSRITRTRSPRARLRTPEPATSPAAGCTTAS